MAPVDGVQGGLGSLMHLKQLHAHLQVVLSIGGAAAADVFPTVASNAMLRHNFARSARDLVEASGLDGIDGAQHKHGTHMKKIIQNNHIKKIKKKET